MTAETPEQNTSSKPRRRTLILIAAAVLVTAVAVWSVIFVSGRNAEPETGGGPTISTDTIVLGTLEGTTQVTGTLEYAGTRELQSPATGTVTWLPGTGSAIAFGDRLFEIDAEPTFLLRGGAPAWREFGAGMTDGADVTALEGALADLGFFAGEPDATFDWDTTAAILAWQADTEQPETGTLSLGRVVFATDELRLDVGEAVAGQQTIAGEPLVTATLTTQEVTAQLKLHQQQLAAPETEVTIDLPGGTRTEGSVVSVGLPTEQQGASGETETVIPVTIALRDAEAVAGLQQASVTIGFASETREDVLSVPVDALLALDADTFGVEIVRSDGTTERVAVTTGLFASGRVEIAGDAISEGMHVVVPSI